MWNWLAMLLGRSRDARERAQAHITFGQTSLGRSLSRTRLLLKKQLWIWPIAAVIVLAFVGYAVSGAIQRTMENSLRSELETLLAVERSMLEKWFKVQESSALAMATDRETRGTIAELLAANEDSARPADLVAAATRDRELAVLHARLAKELSPGMSSHHFIDYVVTDKQYRVIASDTKELLGHIATQYEKFLIKTLEGNTAVCAPFSSTVLLKNQQGKLQSGTPTMFVCAPVRDDNFQVIAALALRIRPEKEFTEILQLGRIGVTGETYAVDKHGLMVSNSRFDETLILLGLLPDNDGAASILNLEVRNPGGDMTAGYRPAVRRRELPLTEICAAAVSGTSGVNMTGYRDYRGLPSVGAWTWLPDYELGIISEIDIAEAFRPLTILKWCFYSLYALLGACAAAIFVFTLVVARLQRQARKAAIEARQLGQYRLQEKIGAGAMGVVYKAQHAMLRRPTAIKMLDVDRVNEAAIARFEREVQITCNLNNPHTVAIYDYGRTPEGVFYYAMEFLDGINLQSLVDRHGPQPEGRVAAILRQICASLYEAHSLGLVHRDIKPANIMLNRRGAEPDVVKVLDFGLVKALEDRAGGQGSGELSGTPLYMSPEAIQMPDSIDARSDLYAVGAVGYFLLTGQTAFNAQTLGELCQQHIGAEPQSPSQRLGRTVSSELEHAILACLEKNRAKRPQTARDLAAMLDRVPHPWTLDQAEQWWGQFERGQKASAGADGSPSGGSNGSEPRAASPSPPSADVESSRTSPQGFDRTINFDS